MAVHVGPGRTGKQTWMNFPRMNYPTVEFSTPLKNIEMKKKVINISRSHDSTSHEISSSTHLYVLELHQSSNDPFHPSNVNTYMYKTT